MMHDVKTSPFEFSEVQKEKLPSQVVFGYQLHKDSKFQEIFNKTSDGSTTKKHFESGCDVITYATKYAFYMLIEEIPEDGLQKSHAEDFFSSFKVLSSPDCD